MELPKRVTLEINKEINRSIKAKQNDTARYLLFTIVDNGVPFSLQGKEVKVFAVKPDGKLVYNTCQITNSTNGEVKLNLTSQMLAVPGTLKVELVISERNEILSTIPFEIEVIKSLRDDSALESTNEFSVLLSKINEGQTLEESISELITEGKPLYNKLNPVVEAGKELNTSLPPKTSEADRILKQLLQATQNGNLDNFINRNRDIFTGHNGNYSGVPIVSSDGVMEVGKYIDFHLPGSDKDYDGRVMIDETKIYHNGSEIYSTTNKPTPADIGAATNNHNHDDRYLKDIQSTPLWIGYHHMSAKETVTPSKTLSECSGGWILVWSDWDAGTQGQDWNFNYTYIPKNTPWKSGQNHSFPVSAGEGDNSYTNKTLYIRDNNFSGHDSNKEGRSYDVVIRAVLEY